jgi:cytochrome P450
MRSRTVNGAHSIISAPHDVHARQRRVLSNAFSERAVSYRPTLNPYNIDVK